MNDIEVVFATASPRRRVLAQKIKYVGGDKSGDPRIVPLFFPTDVKEVTCSDALSTATENARLKGEAAVKLHHGKPVLAFDTVVGLNNRVFGKPKGAEQAIEMFKALCGATHEVITAVYFAVNGKIIEKSEKTYVTFGAFDRDLVYNYVETGAPFDKAGGYNIDDSAVKSLIVEVWGDYDNVVGLPVGLTEKLIEEHLIYGENGYSH